MLKTCTSLCLQNSIAMLAILLSAFTCQAQWQGDTRLTNAPLQSFIAQTNTRGLAVSGNFVHAVWYDYRDNWDLYYKRSSDGGATWAPDVRLTNDPANTYNPSFVLSGTNLHVTWEEFRDGTREIYYKRSIDNGTTWGLDTRLTNDTATQNNNSLAVSGALVHLVWADLRHGHKEIYYRRSTDDGQTWSAEVRLTNNATGNRSYPAISASGQTINMVWTDDRDGNGEVYHKRSSDGGLTWGNDTRITTNNEQSDGISIVSSGTMVHFAWVDKMNSTTKHVYYKKSSDGGLTWTTASQIITMTNADQFAAPNIDISGNFVHVVWEDTRDGNREAYYKKSTNQGVTWEVDRRLTNDVAISGRPQVAGIGNTAHVIWYDTRADGTSEIYYNRNINVLGINDVVTENSVQIFPNPNQGKFTVSCPGIGKNAYMKIYSLQGMLIYQQMISTEQEIDLSDKAKGMYFYAITEDGTYIQNGSVIVQ
jgi:hypothetical protein